MSHTVVVAPFVLGPAGLVVLAAAAGTVAAVHVVGQCRASSAFRNRMQDLLEEATEMGMVIEDGEVQADADLVIPGDDGKPMPMKMTEQGEFVFVGVAAQAQAARYLQRYSYLKVKRDLDAEGFAVVDEVVEDDGTIKLLAQRWGKTKEEVEAMIPPSGPVRIQGFGMPPHTCDATVERLGSLLGRITQRQVHAQAVEPVLRLFQRA